jgi:putative serine protease PepD
MADTQTQPVPPGPGHHPGQQSQATPQPWPPLHPPAGPPFAPGDAGSRPAPPAPPSPASEPPAGPARRRGPGWLALVVAMVITALVAGALALVGVRALDDGTTAAPASAPSSAQSEPLVPSTGDGSAVDWEAVASAVAPSVVTIQVQGQRAAGEGSGVVLDPDGSILTNNHVVAAAANGGEIRVVLSDGRVFSDVEIIGLDPTTDLAVVRIANPPADLTPATIGDSSKVVPGQPVMAVGNPLGLSDTVTTGIVSAVDRPVTTQGESFESGAAEPVVTNAIQTDAAINPGNSGGALVDATGSVIGINSSIASTGGGSAGNIGVGFAIPINEAKRIADELLADGTADHAVLGVSLQDGVVPVDGGERQAAVLVEVAAGMPAEQAGLAEGDAIVAVDGEAVTGAESLTAQIRERAPGTEVTLTVVRDGASREVAVTLGTRQDD